MKVRCIKLLNAHGEPVRTSGWLTLGKEYLVLEVVVDEQNGNRFGSLATTLARLY